MSLQPYLHLSPPDPHLAQKQRLVGWFGKDGSSCHVELTVMAGAADDRPGQFAVGQRTGGVGADVVEGIKPATDVGDGDRRARHVERCHGIRPDLVRRGHIGPFVGHKRRIEVQ